MHVQSHCTAHVAVAVLNSLHREERGGRRRKGMGGCDQSNHIYLVDFIKRFSLLYRDTNLLAT